MRQRVCKKSSALCSLRFARAVLCARSNEIWTEYWLLAAASSSIFVLLLITLALPLWLAGWLGDVAARDPNTKCTNIAASVREELLRYAWPHTFPPPLCALWLCCAVCMLSKPLQNRPKTYCRMPVCFRGNYAPKLRATGRGLP
jgi:hypothetical protein